MKDYSGLVAVALSIILFLVLLIVTLFDGIDSLITDFLAPLGSWAYVVSFLICLFVVGLFVAVIKWLKI
jgi:hypothetical protein